MRIWIKNVEGLAPQEIDDFVKGSSQIEFAGETRREIYDSIAATLVEQEYFAQGKKQRGRVRALLSKVSGLSMPQVTRLIRRYHADGEIRVQSGSRPKFAVKYTVKDLELLIEVDRAHDRLNGAATRRSSNGSGRCSASGSMRTWRRFRCRIFIMCETVWDTGSVRQSLHRPSLRGWRLGNADVRILKDSPGTCGSTPCIKGIEMGQKEFII